MKNPSLHLSGGVNELEIYHGRVDSDNEIMSTASQWNEMIVSMRELPKKNS